MYFDVPMIALNFILFLINLVIIVFVIFNTSGIHTPSIRRSDEAYVALLTAG